MLIAIDPGRSGGIATAVFGPSGAGVSISARPMPDTDGDVRDMFRGFLSENSEEHNSEPDVVVMEQVGGYVPGHPQPGSHMFNFGANFGFLKACAMCNGFRLELVTPRQWQQSLGLGSKGAMSPRDWKNKLKARAQQLYPGVAVTLRTADALLILEYARRR